MKKDLSAQDSIVIPFDIKLKIKEKSDDNFPFKKRLPAFKATAVFLSMYDKTSGVYDLL